MNQTIDQLADVNFDAVRLDAIRAEVEGTKEYARRIHWWVRLFGVVWLVSLAFAMVVFFYMVGAATSATGN